MAALANWWCGLFGYGSCDQLSTFETIMLACITLLAVPIAFRLATWAVSKVLAAMVEMATEPVLKWWSWRNFPYRALLGTRQWAAVHKLGPVSSTLLSGAGILFGFVGWVVMFILAPIAVMLIILGMIVGHR